MRTVGGCIPAIESATGYAGAAKSATGDAGAAERQDVSSRGVERSGTPGIKSCDACRVAASQSPGERDRGTATRLLFVSARDPGVSLRSTPGYSSCAAPRRDSSEKRWFLGKAADTGKHGHWDAPASLARPAKCVRRTDIPVCPRIPLRNRTDRNVCPPVARNAD